MLVLHLCGGRADPARVLGVAHRRIDEGLAIGATM